MSRKEKFIVAYCWMYGETRSNALIAYRKVSDTWIDFTIRFWEKQTHAAFYND